MSVPKSFTLNPGHIFGGRFYWGSMKKKSIKAKWCFIKPGFVAKLTCFQVLFRNSVKHENIFQQMEASGVLPDTDDYKQPLST